MSEDDKELMRSLRDNSNNRYPTFDIYGPEPETFLSRRKMTTPEDQMARHPSNAIRCPFRPATWIDREDAERGCEELAEQLGWVVVDPKTHRNQEQ